MNIIYFLLIILSILFIVFIVATYWNDRLLHKEIEYRMRTIRKLLES